VASANTIAAGSLERRLLGDIGGCQTKPPGLHEGCDEPSSFHEEGNHGQEVCRRSHGGVKLLEAGV